jgi:hypothetical protein
MTQINEEKARVFAAIYFFVLVVTVSAKLSGFSRL